MNGKQAHQKSATIYIYEVPPNYPTILLKVVFILKKEKKKKKIQVDYLVLRWDVRIEDKGKHGKFDNLCLGPFRIDEVLHNNTSVLKNMDDENLSGGLVNGIFLNHYYL